MNAKDEADEIIRALARRAAAYARAARRAAVTARIEPVEPGPENAMARDALSRRTGGEAAFVIVIINEGPRWCVEVGTAGEAQPALVAEQFRSMLHATVDAIFDTAESVDVDAPEVKPD
jgi:hypothetical protein